jgi:hypothetical protein
LTFLGEDIEAEYQRIMRQDEDFFGRANQFGYDR